MNKHEHHNHHAMMENDFRKRFWAVLFLTIPVLLLSSTIQDWLGFEAVSFLGDKYLLFLLSSLIVLWGGFPFYTGAVDEIKKRNWGMMVLVSLAVLSGYLYSVGATFLFMAMDFYWEISTLVLFLLFGHWMEIRAVRGATGALGELAKLIPPMANLVKGKEIMKIETEKLKLGDIVFVKPGEKIPVDGEVIEGESNINEAMITGESKPVKKEKGEKVIGGTLNIDGALKIKVAKIGKDTALSQIIELIKQAQESKPRSQKIADRAAHYLTITAIVVGFFTFAYWSAIAGAGALFALTLTITVIVIACPHALGLAIPTVTTISTSLSAKNGILVKDMKGLEKALKLDYIVFDKTGTLTYGEMGVSDILPTSNWDQKKILSYAAALEIGSEHFIGKAIIKEAKNKKLEIPSFSNFKAFSGQGVKANIEGKEIYIGNIFLINSLNIETKKAKEKAGELASQGKTVVYLADDKEIKALIALSDIIKEESKKAVKDLKKMGIKIAMLTGDNKQVAQYVAGELNLDTFFAEVLPQDKSEKVKELQKGGKIVAMVGDGINDAPALTQSDIGIAIGAGTDVAIESAEIVLVKNNPYDIVKIIKLSRSVSGKMKQNLAWATGYNIIAIPIAAGVLYPWGIYFRPEWAALIMAASSIIVVFNALLLKRVKL